MIAPPGTTIVWRGHYCRAIRDDLACEAEILDLFTGEMTRAVPAARTPIHPAAWSHPGDAQGSLL